MRKPAAHFLAGVSVVLLCSGSAESDPNRKEPARGTLLNVQSTRHGARPEPKLARYLFSTRVPCVLHSREGEKSPAAGREKVSNVPKESISDIYLIRSIYIYVHTSSAVVAVFALNLSFSTQRHRYTQSPPWLFVLPVLFLWSQTLYVWRIRWYSHTDQDTFGDNAPGTKHNDDVTE